MGPGRRLNRFVRSQQDRFSDFNRLLKLRTTLDFMRAHEIWSVLIVGAGWRGLIEPVVGAAVPQVVYLDLHASLNKRPYVRADALQLPFPDDSFDMVLSNAVIEHVGGTEAQRQFIHEQRRVARHLVATTPNRWFPVELHTNAVLRHWSPRWRAEHASVFTRLMSRAEFEEVVDGGDVRGHWFSPTFVATWCKGTNGQCPGSLLSPATE